MDLDIDGAMLQPHGLNFGDLEALLSLITGPSSAGQRLTGQSVVQDWVRRSNLVATATNLIGRLAKPVRLTFFDKTLATNWTLGWHQDRTIAVSERHDIAGFSNWTSKHGILHVEPPFDLLATMVTARVHLDDVDAFNAPLRIAQGSHLMGRIAEHKISSVVAQSTVVECHARAGDIWWYRTPIVHSSAATIGLGSRRVLQVDFSAATLPLPLAWAADRV